MLIKIENLAPKKIINLHLPRSILPENNALVVLPENKDNEFLKNILSINGVERILLTDNLLSCKYQADSAEDLTALLMAEIDDYFAAGQSVLQVKNTADDKTMAEALADALIRPTLNRDNGDIIINDIYQNEIKLSFTGHCAGCPYAHNTLKNVIEHVFLRYMPYIKKITLQE